MEKIIKEKISSLLSQEEEVLSVEQLGGMTNQNYLVKTTNKQYIVKFFGKGTEKLINRQDEKYNLELLKDLDLDVKNYLFDIEAGIKVNEYIESAITLDSTSIKTKFDKIAPILQTIHASGKELRGEFAPFEEIKKYESLIEEKIPYANYEAVREAVFSLEKRLADLGVDRKSCHIDLVPENFIESPQGRLYLIDWEYSSMNDPMWDLAALFLESEFTRQEEEAFLSHYESEQTPVSREKIAIYKILQDAIWSLWTVYKEEQGADFGDYGVSRYQRAVKGLSYYGVSFGLLSGIFWGLGLTISAYIFSIFTDLSPFVVAAAHDFLSIFILLAFLLVKEGKVRLSIFLNIRNVSVIIGALLAGPIGMQANLYAVKYIGSSLASSVSAIYPAISVLLAFFFLKHKISKNTVFGIVLIIGGIIAQTYKVEQVNSFYIGILCALVCAIAWGSESVLSSFAMESELSEIEALLIRQVTSFLSYLVIVLFSHQSFAEVANGQLLGLMIVFAAFDMISYLAYYIAINRLQPAKATGLNVSYVVWTVLFAVVFLGASPSSRFQ